MSTLLATSKLLVQMPSGDTPNTTIHTGTTVNLFGDIVRSGEYVSVANLRLELGGREGTLVDSYYRNNLSLSFTIGGQTVTAQITVYAHNIFWTYNSSWTDNYVVIGTGTAVPSIKFPRVTFENTSGTVDVSWSNSSECPYYNRTVTTTGTSSFKAPFDYTLYGSHNYYSKGISRLYGSVGRQSKRIGKLYGSVNGKTKLIYQSS